MMREHKVVKAGKRKLMEGDLFMSTRATAGILATQATSRSGRMEFRTYEPTRPPSMQIHMAALELPAAAIRAMGRRLRYYPAHEVTTDDVFADLVKELSGQLPDGWGAALDKFMERAPRGWESVGVAA